MFECKQQFLIRIIFLNGLLRIIGVRKNSYVYTNSFTAYRLKQFLKLLQSYFLLFFNIQLRFLKYNFE